MPVDLSVVVCTRDRHSILSGTLEALAAVRRPAGLGVEVVVVDNGSTDATAATVREFEGKLPVSRVDAPQAGLSRARNRGIDAAQGAVLLWLDDDARARPDLLERYAAAIDRHPGRAVFGGAIHPVLEPPTPDWITGSWRFVKNSFAALEPPADDTPIVLRRKFPFGANFAVRRAVQAAHRFDPELGRVAGSGRMASGEERAALRAMFRAGHGGVWVASAAVDHWIPRERQTLEHMCAYFEGQGWEVVRETPALGRRLLRPALYSAAALAEPSSRLLRRLRRPAREWVPLAIAASFSRGGAAVAD